MENRKKRQTKTKAKKSSENHVQSTIKLKGMKMRTAIKAECASYTVTARGQSFCIALRHRFRSQSYGFHILSLAYRWIMCLLTVAPINGITNITCFLSCQTCRKSEQERASSQKCHKDRRDQGERSITTTRWQRQLRRRWKKKRQQNK